MLCPSPPSPAAGRGAVSPSAGPSSGKRPARDRGRDPGLVRGGGGRGRGCAGVPSLPGPGRRTLPRPGKEWGDFSPACPTPPPRGCRPRFPRAKFAPLTERRRCFRGPRPSRGGRAPASRLAATKRPGRRRTLPRHPSPPSGWGGLRKAAGRAYKGGGRAAEREWPGKRPRESRQVWRASGVSFSAQPHRPDS